MGSFSLKGDPLSTQLRRGLVNANSTATSLRLLKRLARQHRTAFIRLWQSAVITTCLTVAFWLRFDFVIPDPEMHRLLLGIGIALVVKLTVFNFIGNDKGWWRFTGFVDLAKILGANIAGSFLFTAATAAIVGPQFSRSVYVIDFLLCFLACAGARLGVRFLHEMVVHESTARHRTKGLLIYGAGAAGLNLVREIRSSKSLQYQIIGFLDDDPHKRNATLLGVRVLGRGRDAVHIVEHFKHRSPSVDEIVIAMPSATGKNVSEALANCRTTGVPCKTIPGLGELLSGKVRVSQIREVALEDLLGREPVNLEHDRIRESVMGRTVLVTGAGGSIGSELCRQLMQFEPKLLVALDQAESDLFKIEMELTGGVNAAPFVPVIGDIRDYERMEEIIREHGVTSVYHAAAYKHVPMMESNLIEAITNNVIGLDNMVEASFRNGVKAFVLISSDKAVNPTNIMGLTKRVSELVVSSIPASDQGTGTRFVSVRFGNVLGSNGSVVPIFKKQIASGGPVTVTHPDMRRYFMTIPEAVQLVLQASTMGKGSEIFVLDMGEPVRILDLARNMIRLTGHEPDVDIPIRFTGLRPGEKLFEELATKTDAVKPTHHEKIMVFSGPTMELELMNQWIAELRNLVAARNSAAILAHLCDIVPEYEPSKEWRMVLGGKSKVAAVGA
jgi:FlaA1/EpsC-like NDP-sugar epimerase